MYKLSSVSLAVALGLSLTSQPLVAAEESDKPNRIIITGSHIKRIEQEPSSPLAVLSAEDIKRSGVTSLSELLQTTVFSNGDSLNNQQTGGFTPGAASYNLRGLRTDRTLVLIDGKRLPSYPFGQNGNVAFVDLNSIPLAEIDSVEILKDGASAVYGSDAIAGVVNIKTKKEFHGSEISLKTTQSDGNYSGNIASLLTGFSSDTNELIVIAEYQKNDALLGKDTDFASTLNNSELSEYSFPGTYFTLDDNFAYVEAIPAEGCTRTEAASDYYEDFPGNVCVYDWAGERQLIPENKRSLVSANWSHYFNDLTLYVKASANQTETISDVDFGIVRYDFYIDASDPRNPIGESMDYSRAFTEMGLQSIETTADNYRAVVGINGLISHFDFDLSFNHGLTEVSEFYADGWMTYASRAALFAAVNSGEINPFQALSDAQIAQYTDQFEHTGRSYQSALSFNLSGEIANWNAGSVYFATGVEVRKESIEDTSDSEILDGEVVGLGSSSAKGDRDIASLFTEFVLPLASTMELNLALRYDNYDDFGSSFNPKASFKWAPSDNFLLRTSWGTGFRAPNLFELHSGEVIGQVGQIPFIKQGNLDLDAESSESFNLGMVLDFSDRYSLSLDAWQIEVEDMITELSVGTIFSSLDENFEGIYEDYLVFNEDDELSHVITPFLNIDKQKAQGIDLNSKWQITRNFEWQLGITHLAKLEQQNQDLQQVDKLAGDYLYPENRINTAFNLSHGLLKHSLLGYYVDSHGEVEDNTEIKSHSRIDYRLQLELANQKLVFMVNNLADKQIPSDNTRYNWPYYEQRLYSPLGRTYSLQWQLAF